MWKKWQWIKKKLQYSIFNSMWLSQIKVWKKVLSPSKTFFFHLWKVLKAENVGTLTAQCYCISIPMWNSSSIQILCRIMMSKDNVFTGGSKVINTSFHFQASENRLSVIAENIFTFSQVLANPAQGILITMHPLKKQVECMVQSTSNHTLSPSSCCRFPHQIDLCDSREHRPHPFRE